jgi:hypothetical protein
MLMGYQKRGWGIALPHPFHDYFSGLDYEVRAHPSNSGRFLIAWSHCSDLFLEIAKYIKPFLRNRI